MDFHGKELRKARNPRVIAKQRQMQKNGLPRHKKKWLMMKLSDRHELHAHHCERNKAEASSSLRGRVFLRPRQSRNLLSLFRSKFVSAFYFMLMHMGRTLCVPYLHHTSSPIGRWLSPIFLNLWHDEILKYTFCRVNYEGCFTY